MHELLVLGGGASGFAAAISYARKKGGKSVLIIEGNDRALKKVALTGNGQCNLTNVKKGKYFGEEELANSVLERVSVEDTLDFFASIGVKTFVKENGKVYPRSLQASSVSDLLRYEAQRLGITLLTNEFITEIKRFGDVFEVITNAGIHHSKYVVYALGGAAYPKLLSSSSNTKILDNLKVKSAPFVPALVQLCCTSVLLKQFKGIKAEVGLSIVVNGKNIANGTGEMHFAGNAISGPIVFSLSPYATTCLAQGKEVFAKIDFFPENSNGEFLEYLEERITAIPNMLTDNLFTTLLHNAIGRAILKECNIPLNTPVSSLNDEQLIKLMKVCKGATVKITDSYGFNYAQSSIGGVIASELDQNLMLNKIKNMFIVGEAVNVCGECGGYNLQWAWSSGILVGNHIAGLA